MSEEQREGWKKSKYQIGKTFDKALADEIIKRMEACENLADICRDDHMPKLRAVAAWRKQNPEFNRAFLQAYHTGRGIISPRSAGAGRVTIRTAEIEQEICDRLEDGELLAQICRLPHMPRQSTVYDWLAIDPTFAGRVARARVLGAASIQADCIDIADDGRNDFYEKAGKDGSTFVALDSENIQRSKLRIDTRKWLVGTLDPRLKESSQTAISINSSGDPSVTIGHSPEAENTQMAYEEYQKLVKGE